MSDFADRLRAMRRQLVSRVRDALDDASPEITESAVGRAVQAGVLVELATSLLGEELGGPMACKMLGELAERSQTASITVASS